MYPDKLQVFLKAQGVETSKEMLLQHNSLNKEILGYTQATIREYSHPLINSKNDLVSRRPKARKNFVLRSFNRALTVPLFSLILHKIINCVPV